MPEQTGPITLEGKAATCLNAITHGGTSRKLFIPGENPDDFFKLMEELFAEYQPGSLNFSAMVTDLAHARWYLWRRQRSSDAAEFELHTAKPDETTWAIEDFNRLRLFDRYKTEAERSFQRALRNVQNVKKEEVREEHWQAQFALQKQRFELEAERFKMTQERQAHPAESKQKPESEPTLDELLHKLKEFRDDYPPPPPGGEARPEIYQNKTVIVQTVSVTSTGHSVETEFHPSNASIRHYLNCADNSKPFVTHILRRFNFTGAFPDNYQWFSQAGVPEAGVLIEVYIWMSLAEAENELPALRALNHLDPLWEAMAA